LARKLVIALAVVVVAVSATAFAASQLSGSAVAQSMPAGTLALAGTEPSCTVVSEGIEYHCTLNSAPVSDISDWTGVVGPTVDTSKHLNGGCRSRVSDGREWECFLGQTAVDKGVISPGLLGDYAANPFTASSFRHAAGAETR
jgi:type 1 fimbria pilin